MPLDSGTQAAMRTSDGLKWKLQNALALQLNVPLTFVRRFVQSQAGNSSVPPPIPYDRLSTDPLDRCIEFQRDWSKWKEHFASLAATQYALPPSNSNPGLRLLRDNWAWSWSEAIELLTAVRRFEADKQGLLFKSNSVFSKQLSSYIQALDEQYLLVIGPALLPDPNAMTDWQFARALHREIEAFNTAVRLGWSVLTDRPTRLTSNATVDGPVYGADYVTRMLYGRMVADKGGIERRAKKIADLYNYAMQFSQLNDRTFRSDAIAKFIAALISHLETSSPTQTQFSVELPVIAANKVREVRHNFQISGRLLQASSSQRVGSAHPSFAVETFRDNSYTARNNYYYESFVLLRNYLNRKFGVYVTPAQRIEGGIPTKVGDRITRLIARLFEADEAAVYRLAYGEPSKPLLRYGSYSEYPVPKDRQYLLLTHMHLISKDADARQISISYRAADMQRTQVCDFFDPLTKTAVPKGQTLSCPNEQCDWGVSACACPIIIGGRTWGVIELISGAGWNFNVDVVKRVEETCSIVGPFFYYQGILASLSRIYKIIADPHSGFTPKIRQVCEILPDLFLAESVAVFFRKQDDSFYPAACYFREDVAQYIGADSDKARATKDLESSILENVTSIQEFTIGEAPFDDKFPGFVHGTFFSSRVGHRLVVIPLSETQVEAGINRVFGLITIVLEGNPDAPSMGASEEVSSAYNFLSSYLTVALQLIYASYVWERTTRSYLSHEVNRLAIEFDARLTRAREAAQKIEDSTLRFRLMQSMSDLGANLRDIRHFYSIFNSVSAIGRSDPLLEAAQKIRDQETTRPVEIITLREIVNEVFLSRQTQSVGRQIKILNNIRFSHKIRVSRRNLREVLGNLADNAIKYAYPKSEIETSSFENRRGDISLIISNVGPPLSVQERRRVFEEGFRAQYAYEKNIPGMGRGLGYARDIMRLYGGDITYRLHEAEKNVKGVVEGAVWHELEIRFPAEMMVRGVGDGDGRV